MKNHHLGKKNSLWYPRGKCDFGALARNSKNEKFEEIFCEKRKASTPLGIDPRTFRLPVICNRKVLGSMPSGVEALLFSQEMSSIYIEKFHLVLNNVKLILNHMLMRSI